MESHIKAPATRSTDLSKRAVADKPRHDRRGATTFLQAVANGQLHNDTPSTRDGDAVGQATARAWHSAGGSREAVTWSSTSSSRRKLNFPARRRFSALLGANDGGPHRKTLGERG